MLEWRNNLISYINNLEPMYKYILICILFCSCSFVDQDVKRCEDDKHFQVNTYLWYNTQIIYSRFTWLEDGLRCLTIDQVDSTKKADYKRAKEFLKEYKKIK